MTHRFTTYQKGVANFIQPLSSGNSDIAYFCRLGCTANFCPEKDDDSEEIKQYWNRLTKAVETRRAGSSLHFTDFYLYLKIQNITSIDDGSVRPRLLGTVHGPLFKNISEELELLEPVQLKLEIAFGVPFCTSVSSEEMSFIQNPKDKQVPTTYYSFEKDMITPPTWPWPLPCCDTGIEYYLMSTLIFSPYSHPGIQVSPPPQNGSLQIASMTKLILESGLHSDFTLISGTGDRFPCHKVFLTPSSQFFATMFRTDMMERKMNECRLDGSSKDGVRALLKFVYYQDVLEPLGSSGLCVELLHLALLYDIPTLAHWARDNMLLKPNCWWDIEGVVSLYFRVRLESGYESLKEKAIQILKTKRARGELMSNSNSNFQELCMGDPNALKELMQLMFCSM